MTANKINSQFYSIIIICKLYVQDPLKHECRPIVQEGIFVECFKDIILPLKNLMETF